MDRQARLHRVGPAGPDRLSAPDRSILAAEVRDHLSRSPRQLPSHYFYDDVGSALFEAICRLPWYGVTRAELGLLARHGAEIGGTAGGFARVIELGSGHGSKLATLLGSWTGRPRGLAVHLVDLSTSALAGARRTLEAIGISRVVLHERPYETGLREAAGTPVAGPTLVLFLGSNVGNFDRPAADALLRQIRGAMAPGDALLLGADLVKPERDLLLAYDDPLGVTAAFNRNLLHRLNRELDADFRVDGFDHRAIWNASASRVEMHLVSRDRQAVRVPRAEVAFTMEPGETIWTESSYKYEPGDLAARFAPQGLIVTRQWIDDRDRFALTLARAADGAERQVRVWPSMTR